MASNELRRAVADAEQLTPLVRSIVDRLDAATAALEPDAPATSDVDALSALTAAGGSDAAHVRRALWTSVREDLEVACGAFSDAFEALSRVMRNLAACERMESDRK